MDIVLKTDIFRSPQNKDTHMNEWTQKTGYFITQQFELLEVR